MPVTYKKIASITIGAGGGASFEFTSIPSTYTDLTIHLSPRSTSAQVYEFVGIRFNDSTTSYSNRYLRGNGSAASSASNATTYIETEMVNGDTSTASTFGSMNIYIPNYAGSTNKSVSVDGVSENNATSAFASLNAGLWSNTAAITKILLFPVLSGSTWKQYSTATLYGISKS